MFVIVINAIKYNVNKFEKNRSFRRETRLEKHVKYRFLVYDVMMTSMPPTKSVCNCYKGIKYNVNKFEKNRSFRRETGLKKHIKYRFLFYDVMMTSMLPYEKCL